jgi:biotin---protein ligase
VIPIKETTLLTEPWQGTCALLVFPGGADLGYQRVLGSDAAANTGRVGASGNWLISQYVAKGGAYLGLCAGGYYGSARCEFEVGRKRMEVIGNRELAFFPGTCRGGAIEGFEYGSELGSAAAGLIVNQDAFESTQTPDRRFRLAEQFRCYVNGGGLFVDAESMHDKGVEVLATYRSKPAVDGGQAAVVYCRSGKGAAILMGPHPE